MKYFNNLLKICFRNLKIYKNDKKVYFRVVFDVIVKEVKISKRKCFNLER